MLLQILQRPTRNASKSTLQETTSIPMPPTHCNLL